MRDICEILDFNRSRLYYQPQEDPSEAVLCAEIEKLSGQYTRYGYRRSITEARDRIGHFITSVYNQKRPHSAFTIPDDLIGANGFDDSVCNALSAPPGSRLTERSGHFQYAPPRRGRPRPCSIAC